MTDPTSTRSEKNQLRLKQVVDVARRLFESRGFEKVGMREIAEAACMSPMQVYRLGLDKQDLLAEVIFQVNEEVIKKIKPFSSSKHKDPVVFIESYLLDLYKQDVAIKTIRKEGAAFGWLWSGKYEALIIGQVMQMIKPIADALTHFEYDEVEARCYAIWSLYYVGYRNAVMNNANAQACLDGIKPSLRLNLRK